jgi:hypothetical protein
MALNVDLSALHAAVRRMGAEAREFQVETYEVPLDSIDVELEKGIELPDLDEVETSNGLLSYKGRQILLYIQDHGWRAPGALRDGSKGNRFHVSDCTKLKQMRAQGRYERYRVTNRLDGKFFISGEDQVTRDEVEGDTELTVCQFCVGGLNYKNAGADAKTRRHVAQTFDIEEFFSTYSSFFSYLPSRKAGKEEKEGYAAGWSQIAGHYKADQDFRCESCSVDLSDQKNLLHVHHLNGVKGDNKASNLQALCVACHREQPHHGHLFVPHKDTRLINRLRREQGLLGGRADWDKVFEYCDPGLEGLLQACRSAGSRPPEVGFDVQDRSQAVVANLELAWPRAKRGVAISDEDREAAGAQGWKVWTMFEALDKVDKLVEETRR